MKKNIAIIISLILLKIILPIKPYVELNHLKIIDEIEITCEEKYKITYIEKIPKKEDNGINYDKKTYKTSNTSLTKGIKELEKNKNFYTEKSKIKILNCKNKDKIKEIIKRG